MSFVKTKKCSGCGLELPLTEFNKKRRSKDGLQEKCRKCFSEYNKKRYASDPERFKADVREYREKNIENVFETRMRMCKKNPSHKNANMAVGIALKVGIISNPGVCYGCGCTSDEHRIEAHHHDYARPLDIVWLCTPCHYRMDAQRREHERAVRERCGE